MYCFSNCLGARYVWWGHTLGNGLEAGSADCQRIPSKTSKIQVVWFGFPGRFPFRIRCELIVIWNHIWITINLFLTITKPILYTRVVIPQINQLLLRQESGIVIGHCCDTRHITFRFIEVPSAEVSDQWPGLWDVLGETFMLMESLWLEPYKKKSRSILQITTSNATYFMIFCE